MKDAPGDAQKKLNRVEPIASEPARRPARANFRYYIHDGITCCRLQLIGELTEAEVPELNGCWRTARTTLGARQLILDLHALRSVDEAGKRWLAGMAQDGATYSPDQYLRDMVAGKHTVGGENLAPAPKPGLFGRLLGLLRGAGVEAAK